MSILISEIRPSFLSLGTQEYNTKEPEIYKRREESSDLSEEVIFLCRDFLEKLTQEGEYKTFLNFSLFQ